MKRILICGASGFIGRNLFEHFSKREDVEVFGTYNKKKFTDNDHLLQADFLSPWNAFDLANDIFGKWDAVVYAAGISAGVKVFTSEPETLFTQSNVMNMRVLEAAFRSNVKHFIFLSCSVMYPMDLGRPAKENDVFIDRIHPSYRLGALVKLLAEELCYTYSHSQKGGTKFTVIRHSNCYGPHDKFDLERGHFFGATVEKVMSAPDGGTINVWGDGKEERDFLYVSDLCDFVEKAIGTQRTHFALCNVGFGASCSVGSIACLIANQSGKNITIVFDENKPTIKGRLALDRRRAQRYFDWTPHVGISEGIVKTLEWYKNNAKKE